VEKLITKKWLEENMGGLSKDNLYNLPTSCHNCSFAFLVDPPSELIKEFHDYFDEIARAVVGDNFVDEGLEIDLYEVFPSIPADRMQEFYHIIYSCPISDGKRLMQLTLFPDNSDKNGFNRYGLILYPIWRCWCPQVLEKFARYPLDFFEEDYVEFMERLKKATSRCYELSQTTI
jgi:hypothetical protein